MKYLKRIADMQLIEKLEASGGVLIVGPKGCGKTRTAKERCNTVIEFQDEMNRAAYLSVVETAPALLLENKKPILFDEWQDAPKIWGTIRKACDDNLGAVGEFFLTGSTSRHVDTPHTGTGRIAMLSCAAAGRDCAGAAAGDAASEASRGRSRSRFIVFSFRGSEVAERRSPWRGAMAEILATDASRPV